MAQNLKPIIDELKAKLANRDQIRDTVIENLRQTRETVEKTLKEVGRQAKDSRLLHDYVIPFVESEQADQAMKYLNTKLGASPIVSKLEQARKAVIDLKVDQAKEAEPVVEAKTEAVETTEETASEEESGKPRKKSTKSQDAKA